MNARACLFCLTMLFLFLPPLAAQEVKQPLNKEGEASPTLDTLPGATKILVQLDQSFVSSGTSREIFLSVEDPRVWKGVPVQFKGVPKSPNYQPVGGDRNRIFLTTHGEDDFRDEWLLVRVDVGSGKSQLIRTLKGELVGFANAELGAASLSPQRTIGESAGEQLEITRDGGETWESVKLPERNASAELSNIVWVNSEKLLLGNTAGKVRLLEVLPAKPVRLLWSVQAINTRLRSLEADGEFAWIFEKHQLIRINLSDGKLNTAIEVPREFNPFKMDACNGKVFVMVTKRPPPEFLLLNWGLKDKEDSYQQLSLLTVEDFMFTAIPMNGNRHLILFGDGKGAVLNGENNQLAPATLQVFPIPNPEKENTPTQDQVREFGRLLREVSDADKKKAILQEATQMTELTGRQRFAWIIEQLQQAVQEQKEMP